LIEKITLKLKKKSLKLNNYINDCFMLSEIQHCLLVDSEMNLILHKYIDQ